MSQNDILLESGTNEVEVLEFIVNNQSFGINVAKVLSIDMLLPEQVSHIPTGRKELLGMYQYRGNSIPLINLHRTLCIPETNKTDRPLVVSLEFNRFICGVVVDGVNRIHRVSWNEFESLSKELYSKNSSTLGVISIGQTEVLILDIESIASRLFDDISMESIKENDVVITSHHKEREDISVVLAEDSRTISKLIVKILGEAGYSKLTVYENGKDAWEGLKVHDYIADKGKVHMVISDIEMPQMDGLTLCKNFRDLEGTKDIPFVMFSSLINDQMAHKCESVGATGWITKPEIHTLIDLVDKLCGIERKTAQ